MIYVTAGNSGCRADVVFAIDSSTSIGQLRFDNFKQMAMDIERSLLVGQNGMHVGFVQYSANAKAVFSLKDSYDQYEIANRIWASDYTGGAGYAANGLAAVRDMFTTSGTGDNPRIVVFFTDGPDYLAAIEANNIAEAMKQDSDMYVVRKYAILPLRLCERYHVVVVCMKMFHNILSMRENLQWPHRDS